MRRITHVPGALADEDEDEDNDDIVMLEKKIRTSSMPEQAHKVCETKFQRNFLKCSPSETCPTAELTNILCKRARSWQINEETMETDRT